MNSRQIGSIYKRAVFRFLFSIIFSVCYIYSSEALAIGPANNYSFDYFSQADGLPNNLIQYIFQDRKGWIWFGTSQGLSRFDGNRFVNFLNDPEDSTSLSGNLVRVIFEDSRGNLMIGTENG